MGTAGEWVLPAYDVFVLQWTILRKRVWRRKDGGKGRKCAQVWASMKGNERALFEEWARAWGTKEEDMSTMELRCTITHSDGHTICSAYLHPQTQLPQMHYTTSIWSGMPKILSQRRGGKVTITGMFVNAQSMTASKWQEIKTVALRNRATLVAVAEICMGGGETRPPVHGVQEANIQAHGGREGDWGVDAYR